MAVFNSRASSGGSYSEQAQVSKWNQGFKKGPFFTTPMVSEPIVFKDALDPLVRQARQEGPTEGSKCTDPHKV